MIIETSYKPYVPKYANFDYLPVYQGNMRVGWIKVYQELRRNNTDNSKTSNKIN